MVDPTTVPETADPRASDAMCLLLPVYASTQHATQQGRQRGTPSGELIIDTQRARINSYLQLEEYLVG